MGYLRKGNGSGDYFRKGIQNVGYFVKAGANILDHPLTAPVMSLVQPELGAGIASLKASGVLEKLK